MFGIVRQFWWALAKRQPLEGLKLTSIWIKKSPDHKRLVEANFFCALLFYRTRLFKALCGGAETLAYLEDDTPLPDGVISLVKRAYSSSDAGVVSEIQDQIGKMDVKRSGLAADILRVCGLGCNLKLYNRQ